MARRTKTTVYYAKIRALLEPGGQIHSFSEDIRSDVLASSRRIAPKRSGLLKASMFADRIGTNGYVNSITVYNTAPYAAHVEWDTSGTDKWVRLYGPPNWVAAPARWAHTEGSVHHGVKGYAGKHFMLRGLKRGLLKNGIRL